jgi:hypothetical protein
VRAPAAARSRECAHLLSGMKVSACGTKVAGAPIGGEDFCGHFVQLKVQDAMAKIRALQGIHPQVGMLLLRLGCMPLLNYLEVVLPSLAAEHFEAVDTQVADFVLLLLTLPGCARSLPCAEDRMRRSGVACDCPCATTARA